MKVLSLFDGMSCGQIALNRLGIKVDKYYASEIDKWAIQITQKNYPDTIQVGDITKLDLSTLPNIDLVMGGSPCQGFSFAGKQLAFHDPRSELFFEFVKCVKELNPKYFLLENVKMKKEYLAIISEYMGVEPIFINSSLVSAQSRQRYYWTNIPRIKQPEDKGIVLRDILETETDYKKEQMIETKPKKAYVIPREILKDNERQRRVYDPIGKSPTILGRSDSPKITTPKQIGIATNIKGYAQNKRVYSPDGKSPTVTTCGGGHREPKIITSNYHWRKLTPLECERLQTVPDNYTEGVSNTQRYKMLGNGWTVDVICHILKNMETNNEQSF